MKILHIIMNCHDPLALEMARRQKEAGHEPALLLLHDGVYLGPQDDLLTFLSEQDLKDRGLNPDSPSVDYHQIVELLFQYDKVICWP